MYAHWAGDFPSTWSVDINTVHVLPTSTWEQIGAATTECQRNIPSDFGRPPRDIYKINNRFKAEEWKNWITLYSLIFLKEHMPPREYSGQSFEYLSAHRISLHYILHVADSILQHGPPWAYWQFPMERYCGMIGQYVRSRVHPYTSLANQLKIRGQLNHIRYLPSFASRSFTAKKPCATWVKKNILALKDRPEELYWPRKQYELNKLEYRRLKQHYAYILDGIANISELQFDQM
ncbi:uncharacterized protein VTP21DRAFT_11190 [Calcarisporiella thermophila]|uniref:uncharacterized protein n=1 Tax=Calcarisporiella thermophila TaxID=911321 RepID=UPI00374478BF